MALFSVDEEKCKRDGICVDECPAKIIQLPKDGSSPRVVDGGEELCINCGHCVAVCPHEAMTLATMSVSDCVAFRKDLMPSWEQVDHLLRFRRSVRTYKQSPVDRETLEDLIDTSRYAPSGHNLQPVHWIVIEDRNEVHRLGEIVVEWMRSMIDQGSPVAEAMHFDQVVAFWEKGVDRVLRGCPHLVVVHGERDFPTAQNACIIALAHFEIGAFARGLGACWAGYFNAAANFFTPMQEALDLPDDHQVYGAMMIGHAKYRYHRIPRRNDARIRWR